MTVLAASSIKSEYYSYRNSGLPYGEWWSIVSGDCRIWHSYTSNWNGSYTEYYHYIYSLYVFIDLDVEQGTALGPTYLSIPIAANLGGVPQVDVVCSIRARAEDDCPIPPNNSYPTGDAGLAWMHATVPKTAAVAVDSFVIPSSVTTPGTVITSADISAVLQEVIDRPGWVAGNKIGLYVYWSGSTALNASASRQYGFTSPEIEYTMAAPTLSGVPGPGQRQNTLSVTGTPSASSYNVYWSTSPGVTKSSAMIAGPAFPYAHSGLLVGVTYYYAVSAVVEGVETGLSNEIALTTFFGRELKFRSYWKRFMARNPNYKGRRMEIYEGQVGQAESEFNRTWVGKLTNVTTQKGEFTFESTDLLKDLSQIDVPPKLDIKLATDLAAGEAQQITLTSVDGLDAAAGYIRIQDEIIGYATLDGSTKALHTLARGAFATQVADHATRDKVQKVRYYAPANPWDILRDEMLRVDAGISDADIDSDAFELGKRTPGNDLLFRAVLSEPTKLDKLFFEITDILDAKPWVGEDLRITIRRNLPNAPGRAYYRVTDGKNIVDDSASVDFNEKSRLTRMLIYWHKSVLGKMDDPAAFGRLDIAVDADAESSYGDEVEKKIFCRWIDPVTNEEDAAERYVKNLGMRQVRRCRDAQPVIALSLSLRDLAIKTGDHVRLDTDELVRFDGDPIANANFQVVKRELQDDFSLKVSLLQMVPRRVALIAPNGYPDYLHATDAQREYGFITLATGLMTNGDEGYYIW